MSSDLKEIMDKTGDVGTQYDITAKNILARKSILSRILASAVDEFKGMAPEDIEKCIEGEIYVSKVPVSPGMTNTGSGETGDRLKQMNTIYTEDQEGMVVFDVLFYVRLRDGISQVIINIEAQKDDPSGYDILNRAIFYVCRLVSSQKERDFTKSHYNDLKRVYSIWVCMNMEECIWNTICLEDHPILGAHQWKGKLNMLNIVMLGLPNEIPEQEEKYELHRLLSTLFSDSLRVDERVKILEDEYNIPMQKDFMEEVEEMCNLSQGILERGIEKGMKRGMEKGMEKERMEMARKLLIRQKDTHQEIAQLTGLPLETVENLAKGLTS